MSNEAKTQLSGPSTELAAFEHLVGWHNWTEDEIRELLARHKRTLTAWGIHRLEHSDALLMHEWDHEHG